MTIVGVSFSNTTMKDEDVDFDYFDYKKWATVLKDFVSYAKGDVDVLLEF